MNVKKKDLISELKKSIKDDNFLIAYSTIFVLFDKYSQKWFKALCYDEQENLFNKLFDYYQDLDDNDSVNIFKEIEKIKENLYEKKKSNRKFEYGRLIFESWWNEKFVLFLNTKNFIIGHPYFTQTDIYKLRNNIIHSELHKDATNDIVLDYSDRKIRNMGPFGLYHKANGEWRKVLNIKGFCKLCSEFFSNEERFLFFEEVDLDEYFELEFLFLSYPHEKFKESIDSIKELVPDISQCFQEYEKKVSAGKYRVLSNNEEIMDVIYQLAYKKQDYNTIFFSPFVRIPDEQKNNLLLNSEYYKRKA